MSRESEVICSAYGVASSFFETQGLFLDLGGGSIQLSQITCKDGELRLSETPALLPYGAATLTKRLERMSAAALSAEIKVRLKTAVSEIGIEDQLKQAAKAAGGFKMYVSGGGFRGLGHFFLSQNCEQYPLPIITGFSCTGSDIRAVVQDLQGPVKQKIFRVSDRRAQQLPAVLLLVNAALDVFPEIRKVMFSQSSIREGLLFKDLPKDIRVQDPLLIATHQFEPACAAQYLDILRKAVPSCAPPVIRNRLLPALVNTAFVHSSYPRELQAVSALHIASTGVLAYATGVSHEVRALLGLALCQRWGGELFDKKERDAIVDVVSPRVLAWWALYCGHLMYVIGGVYPGGIVREDNLSISASEEPPGSVRLKLAVSANHPQTAALQVKARINNLEKKLRKLTKEFGPLDSCKVHAEVIWV